jgi:uncharacterized coiled-coil DUF342 family protein
VDPGAVIGIVIGLTGLSGVIFTALRWRRDDTSAAVQTQSTVLGDMARLNDELRTTTATLRSERDECRGQAHALTVEVERLKRDRRRQLPPGDATEEW